MKCNTHKCFLYDYNHIIYELVINYMTNLGLELKDSESDFLYIFYFFCSFIIIFEKSILNLKPVFHNEIVKFLCHVHFFLT